jgi:hypothetical protein
MLAPFSQRWMLLRYVRVVPEGTPVFVASGKPAVVGVEPT